MEAKILIVDDLQENLDALRNVLSSNGFKTIESAKGSAEAITLAKKKHFDVIVTDMVMEKGEEEGYELVEHFRELSPLVIVITSFPKTQVLKACMRAGAYDYIDKTEPEPYKSLVESINNGLKSLKQKNIFVDREGLYLKNNYDLLRKTYSDRHIAILDENVIDDDEDFLKLKNRIDKQYPYSRVFIVYIP